MPGSTPPTSPPARSSDPSPKATPLNRQLGAECINPGQTERAWCLSVLTNAVVTWTTEDYALAVARLRSQGREIPNDLLTHISPAHRENINYFGIITVDIEAGLAKLDTNGHRSLRT